MDGGTKGNRTTTHTRPNHTHATWTFSPVTRATHENRITMQRMRNIPSAIEKDAKEKKKKNKRKKRHTSSEGMSKEGRRGPRAMARLRTTRDANERMG